jgi:hypothetical protein
MQLLAKAAKQQDPDDFWDHVFDNLHARYYPTPPKTKSSSSDASSPPTATFQQALTLPSDKVDELWENAFAKARAGVRG